MGIVSKQVKGFITVEFSLLIIIIFIVYSFLISIGVYMYNQCVLQTNGGLLAVEGISMLAKDSDEKMSVLRQKESHLYREKYIFVEEPEITYSVSGNEVVIQGEGRVENPTALWGIGDEEWSFQTKWEVDTINPKNTLRLCKRLIKLGKWVMTEEEVLDE